MNILYIVGKQTISKKSMVVFYKVVFFFVLKKEIFADYMFKPNILKLYVD